MILPEFVLIGLMFDSVAAQAGWWTPQAPTQRRSFSVDLRSSPVLFCCAPSLWSVTAREFRGTRLEKFPPQKHVKPNRPSFIMQKSYRAGAMIYTIWYVLLFFVCLCVQNTGARTEVVGGG